MSSARIFAVFSIFLFFSGVIYAEDIKAPVAKSAVGNLEEISDEEIQVCKSLMDDPVVVQDMTADLKIIGEELSEDLLKQWEKQWNLKIDRQIIADFNKKNGQAYSFKGDSFAPRKNSFISKSQMEEIFKNDGGWDTFRKIYGRIGIAQFSRVGFSSDKTQAVIYQGIQEDWLAGGGSLLFLMKENGAWVVKAAARLWVS